MIESCLKKNRCAKIDREEDDDDDIQKLKTMQNLNKNRFLFFLLAFVVLVSYCIIFPLPPLLPVVKDESNSLAKQEIEDRRINLLNTCQNLRGVIKQTKNVNLFYYKPLELQFCLVPKCGSSYWLRVFKALSKGSNKGDFFNMTRYSVHRTHTGNLKVQSKVQNNSTIRFLVTRSPYSRLYSAYVDKIFLPSTWGSIGCTIIRYYRQNPTESSLRCGYDVTFSEFLKMVANKDPNKKTIHNVHWGPIENHCNPCKVKYNFIIKQETFGRDRDYLMSKLGINEPSIQNYNNLTHMQFALTTINDLSHTIKNHFYNGRKKKPACYKTEIFLQKLFTSFQIQGYIRSDATLNLNRFGDLKNISIEKIVQVLQDICREFPVLTREEWQEQRRMFMINAYREIDRDVLEGIKRVYFYDFEIFKYDMEPEEIFGHGKT